MPWIKVDTTTPSKPEIVKIAAATGLHPDHVLGTLVRFWCWCDSQTDDGTLRGVDLDTLCALFKTPPEFWRAVEKVGWISIKKRFIRIPNFARHMGQNSRNRERVRRHRERKAKARKGVTEQACNADVTLHPRYRNVTVTLPKRYRNALEERRGEERRRESALRALPASCRMQDAGRSDAACAASPLRGEAPRAPAKNSPTQKPRSEPPESPEAIRQRSELVKALRDVAPLDDSARSWKRYHRVASELLAANPPYTATEVRQFPELLERLGWEIVVTPECVAKHIHLVRKPPPKAKSEMDELREMLARWVSKGGGNGELRTCDANGRST